MSALTLPKLTEGRVFARALIRTLALLLCCGGFIIVAQGLWIPAKAMLAQALLDRAFEASLAERKPMKPWPWADTTPVARVSVARLGVSDVVLSGGSGQAMAFGPTMLKHGHGSGMVTVLAAHRDTHFAFVRDLAAGDIVTLQNVDGRIERFRVVSFQTVRWNRFAVPRDPARPLLALTTCYPFDAVERGPWRRVAWAEKIDQGVAVSSGKGSPPNER